MTLSILIPVYNEEKTIKIVCEQVHKLKLGNIKKEIIIVDDCSTDDTSSEIDKFRKSVTGKIIVSRHKKNMGKGAAIRTGLSFATGDYLVIQDADFEYNPADIKRLLEYLIDSKSDVVYGTRLNRWPSFRRDESNVRFFLHYLGNRLLSLFASILYAQWITDMETGYKLIPRRIMEQLSISSSGFEFEAEITAKILRRGFKIREIAIATNPRGYDEGKKIRTFRDGFKALITLIKYRII